MKRRFVVSALMILGIFTSVFSQIIDDKKLSPSLKLDDIQDVNVFNGKVSIKYLL